MDCSLPGSSIHGILQARILEWVAISFSRASSQPRDRTQVSHIAGRRFYHLSHQESPIYHYTCLKQIPGNLTIESHTCFLFFFLTLSTPSCVAYKNRRWSSLREPGQKENWNLSETGWWQRKHRHAYLQCPSEEGKEKTHLLQSFGTKHLTCGIWCDLRVGGVRSELNGKTPGQCSWRTELIANWCCENKIHNRVRERSTNHCHFWHQLQAQEVPQTPWDLITEGCYTHNWELPRWP